uniref:Uncharacterized protein n=1 Tax=Avena sativa TaxID=4498 RepID=A0ACD5XUU8_AVESA
MEEWSVSKKRTNQEWEMLKAEVARMFQPLVRNLSQISALRSPYDLEDYQIGMLFGAFVGCVGCYQLWKMAPSVFVDVALAFLFYKLSIVSSELHRQHKSNSLTTRLKFGTILVMFLKDIKKKYVLLDAIRMPVFLLYICCFLFDVAGLKKYGRRGLISFVNLLRMRSGLKEILLQCRVVRCGACMRLEQTLLGLFLDDYWEVWEPVLKSLQEILVVYARDSV